MGVSRPLPGRRSFLLNWNALVPTSWLLARGWEARGRGVHGLQRSRYRLSGL